MQVSTVLEIKNLTAEGYYSITGSRGLQLRVTKYGKEFYFRYSWKGKRQLFKIGTSDSVSLSDARKKAIELSELVRKGANPKEQKTAGKEECTVEVNRKTFKECALDWVKERATNNFWKNNVKGEANTLSRLSNHVFPKIGEIIGGSERESDYDKLMTRIEEMHIPMKDMWWYLDTRKFGTCPHSGFGLGFERLLLFVTGMSNIRDVIPFPRTPRNADF